MCTNIRCDVFGENFWDLNNPHHTQKITGNACTNRDLIIYEDVSKNKPERRTDKPSFNSVPVFQQLILSWDLISWLLHYDADALQIYLSKAWHLLLCQKVPRTSVSIRNMTKPSPRRAYRHADFSDGLSLLIQLLKHQETDPVFLSH